MRVGSYPLRIATGRNEGSGVRNAAPGERLGPRGIPQEQRTCRVCTHAPVEDLPHFLLECPAYAEVKQRHPLLFSPQHTVSSAILNYHNQAALAACIRDMLARRQQLMPR